MTAGSIELFVAAVVALFLAHVVRAVRHSFFFASGDLPERFDLLMGLSVSYAINTVLPLRVGELVRALFIAVRLRLRLGYVLATIVAERLADAVVVGLIAAVLAGTVAVGGPDLRLTAFKFALVATVLATAAVLVHHTPRARRVVWGFASIFNESIRFAVVEFFSSVGQLVTGGPYFSPRFLVTTAGMWGLYLGAFALFAAWAGRTLADVSYALLGAPLRPLFEDVLLGRPMSSATLALLVFNSVPVAAVMLYGLTRRRDQIRRSIRFVRRFGLAPAEIVPPPISHRFRDTGDYASFLRSHFTTTNQIVSNFAVDGTDGAVVHRLLPGGSDAITAVVEVDGTLGIRKFATNDAGTKLEGQAAWLRNQGTTLPLPEVVSERRLNGRYRYDMPYILSARDFYDVIHTGPVRNSMGVLRDVVEHVTRFHEANARGPAADAVVDAYLDKKVRANAKEILEYAREVVPSEYTINGEPYALDEWERLLDMDWLRAQIHRRETAVVHGDLTIENIIVCPDRPGGWYIIDPNPENVFNTPLIDWAKLMQSLELGYEALNRGGPATVRGGDIRLPLTRSNAYTQLHTFLAHTLNERLGCGGLREVEFHHLVNYLRLTPYKIRHNPPKGVTFFACTSLLLRRYATGERA